MRAGSASYPNFLAVTLFPHSLPVAVQDLREKPDRPQNLKLCRLRLNFKALRRSCLAADLVPEEDVCYTTPEDPRVNAVVSQFPGDQGSGARWVVAVPMMGRKCSSLHYRALRQSRAARQEIL